MRVDQRPEEQIDEWTQEDFKPDRSFSPTGLLYEKPKAKYFKTSIALGLLCLGLSAVFWLSPRYGSLLFASRTTVFTYHEYWRLITAVFVHGDIRHLLSNMPLFIVFGWLLRNYFGRLAFPLMSLLAGACANAATLYFYNDHTRLIGASGVVYAMVALWLAFYMKYEKRYGFGFKLLRVTGFTLVLLFPTTYNPTTSYLAHLFGFIFGLIGAVMLILTRRYDEQEAYASDEHPIG